MNEKVKVGVIGVGHMGRLHLRKLLALPEAEVVGAVEPSAEKREALKSEFPVRFYETVSEVLFDSDAVVISTPTATHFSLAKQALAAGVDVLVEKPATETLAEAEELCAFAEANQRILQVGLLERHRLAAFQPLPTPNFVSIVRHTDRVGREPMVDVVQDLMIHDLDLLLSIYGEEPTRIEALAWKTISPTFDIAHAWMDFASGRRAYLSASRVSPVRERKIEWWSREGHLILDLQAGTFDALGAELSDFLKCVASRTAPKVDGRSALRCQRLLQNVLASLPDVASVPASTFEIRTNHEV